MTLHRAGIYNLSRLVPVPSEARLPLLPRWAHPPFTLLTLLPAVLLCLAAGAHAHEGSVATDTAAATISSFSGLTRAPTEESVIDVAVFYTPQAREAQDGHDQIKAKIDLMVAETNRAYTDSGVDQRINPVVVEEVAYTETSLLTDIVHLKGPSDGHMDEVHAIRDRVWADIVMLIRASGGGQAVTMLTESTDHARNAFGLSGAHTGVFAHELGHIMGLKHDRYEECDASRCNSALSADAYGYVNQRAFDENAPASSRWRTIMAYHSQCGRDGFNCQWLLRFSNPNQLYPDAAGDPLGVALTSDNEDSIAVDGPANAVRVLNETRDTVADFRQGRAVKVFFDAGPYSVTEGGTVTVTVRLDAAPGRTLNIPIPLTANSLDGAWAGDYAMPSSIIFGSNQTEQTFSLTAVNDTVQEDEETVTLGFGEPLPAGVTVGSQATATVTLTDNDTVPGAPSVAEIAITSEPGPAYAAGEEVEVTVIFTRPVTVTGTPGLGLTIGTTTRPMVYQGARSASEVLVFAYTVADGESDTDGVSIPENSLEGTIRDSANQDTAILTHAAVDADHRVDGVAPELDTAAAAGAVVTLTFDEVLDETSIPAEDAFTVTAAGATLPVDSVEVFEMVVTLTLDSHVVHGQVVRLDYTPGTKPLQDLAGNAADPLSNTVVTNETAMPVYDTDRDGLIEITTLAQLDAMRHDLDGDGIPVDTGTPAYATAFPAAGARLTCGVDSGCAGYELTMDLDFDTDEDGQVDADDTYWNNGAGWVPIGNSTDPFATTFEGNGHTIGHLFVDRNTDYVGLFGHTEGRFFVIRHVALTNVQVTGNDYVGGLVGRNAGGLLGSYVTGQVSGDTYTGGLVGYNHSAILGSYATGQVSGHTYTGGLVGYNALAIVGSYATGRVWGSNWVGGLSGTSVRSITASYATGRVPGRNNVGGLVGEDSVSGTITASYWDTTTSGQATGDGGAGQSTAALQAPTGYSGIYADWNVDVDGNGTPDDPWDLGTASQYPVLKADLDGDGTASWQEFGHQLRGGPTLTAAAGVGQVVLQWTAVEASHWDPAPAVTYTLTRDHGATVEAIAENLSGLGYTDTDVTAGETYTYQVAAVVTGGEAARSALTTSDPVLPDMWLNPPASDPVAPVRSAATYSVTFQGTWTNSVTSGGVPSGAHFTTLIGGVHNAGVTFLREGGMASAGVESMAELGGTPTLESEINAAMPNAFAVIEQSIASGGTATATVDITLPTDHPRVTLLSMVAPSPDWFVGVSGLTLLDDQGDWLASRVLNLYPWDAGTEEGTEFSLSNSPTSPQGVITSLRGTGKFSNEPIATLTFTRQSVNTAPELLLAASPAAIVEAGGSATVTVEITNGVTFEEDQEIALAFAGTATKGTDYTVALESLTLTAGESSVATTVTAVQDRVDDDAETILITASHGGGAIGAEQTITIIDDDATPCSGGMAGTYPCSNVDLMSFLALADIGGGEANDIWGWTDSTAGKEYAIMGRTNGTSFVDISDPVNPIVLGNLPPHSANSTWRDIKVYADHAFMVTEAKNSGMQVFDLTQLRSVASPPATFSETAHYPGFSYAHNLAVNEDSGFAYAVGTNNCSGGLHMIDIQTPANPTSAGCFSDDGYTHDAQCVNYDGPDLDHQGKEICFNSNVDTLTIVDVTNKKGPVMLSRTGYSGSRDTHQGWLTEDQAYFLLGDEEDEAENPKVTNTRTYLWDVSDLDEPALIGSHDSTTTATDHNQYVKGGYTYQSNYRAGLRILDITDIANGNLTEVAFFDVYPGSDSPDEDGTWSNYPFFDSGIVIVSEIEQGLFILRPNLVDGVNPALASASVNGAAVTLTYGEALDGSSTPATDAFTVTVAGSGRTVTHVSVSGRAVTLTLASAVTDGQEVTVTYTVPGTNPIRDAVGNDARPLANRAVGNNTPDTTAPVITTTSPILVPENETAVATLTATDDTPSDPLTWTIPSGTNGGADADQFTLSSAGVLAFAAATDYENPDDADGDNVYEVTVQVSDGDNTTTADIGVTLQNVIELFTQLTGPSSTDYAENGAVRVATYIASSEADRDGIAWNLGGDEAEHFSIDNPAGVLRFHIDPVAPSPFPPPPDFEAPVDDDADNVYELIVLARAGSALALKTVIVTVTDENEAGKISLTTARPKAGSVLTATLTDPDGVTAGTVTWQWQRSAGRNTWEVIAGAGAAGYTPTAADTGAYLRVTATYTDSHAAGQTAHAVSAEVVTAELLSSLSVTTNASTADPDTWAMRPEFSADTLHYAVGCTASRDTMRLAFSAANAGTRVAVNGIQVADRNATVVMTVQAHSDVPITLTTGSTGAHTTYVVHCLDTRNSAIERTVNEPGASTELISVYAQIGPGRQTHSTYLAIIDANGVPRWQQRLNRRATHFKAHTDGRYPYSYWTANSIAILDENLEEVERVATTPALMVTGGHDFAIRENGNYVFMAYEPAFRDFSAYTDADDNPYGTTQPTEDSVIEEVTPAGSRVFFWNSWNDMYLNDCLQHRFPRDYAHINSVQVVDDADIIASFRGCSQVWRIDRQTQAGEWLLGRSNRSDAEWEADGIRTLKIVGDPHGEFCGQHSARLNPNGHLLLFDNGNHCLEDPETGDTQRRNSVFSRIVEYALDPDNGEAVFVRQHCLGNECNRFSTSQGHIHRMDNGHWLVSWGRGDDSDDSVLSLEASLTEVDPLTNEELLAFKITHPEYHNSEQVQPTRAYPVEFVALADAPGPLTAEIVESPASSLFHLGPSDAPKVVVAFSQPVVDPDPAAATWPWVNVQGATIASVSAHTVPGDPANAWLFTLTPAGVGPIAFALVAGQSCASGGICTAGGAVLTGVPAAAHTIPWVDTVAPALAAEDAATVRGATLTLTFDEALATANTPASAFAVTGGTTRTISGVAVNGSTVQLTIDPPILYGESGIEVGYTAPSREALADAAGNKVASFEDRAVANETPATTLSTGVSLSLDTPSVSEGGSAKSVALTAMLNRSARPAATAVTVEVGTAGDTATEGTDYAAVDDLTLTIPAYMKGITVRFTLTPMNDRIDEPGESLTVSGSTAVAGLIVTPPGGLALDIEDNDAAPSLALSVSASTIDEDGGTAAVTVSTGSGSTYATDQTVRLAVAGTATETADYTISGRTLPLPAGVGTGASMVTATVTGLDDSLDDDDETIEITGSRNGVAFGSRQTIAIEDDDWPELTVTFRQADYRVAEGAHVDLPVTLNAVPERRVTIPIEIEVAGGAEAVDYSVSPASLTFGAGETDKTLRVRASNDSVVDPGEGVTLSLGTPLPERISEGGIAETTVAIRDTDFTFAPAFAAGTGTAESGRGHLHRERGVECVAPVADSEDAARGAGRGRRGPRGGDARDARERGRPGGGRGLRHAAAQRHVRGLRGVAPGPVVRPGRFFGRCDLRLRAGGEDGGCGPVRRPGARADGSVRAQAVAQERAPVSVEPGCHGQDRRGRRRTRSDARGGSGNHRRGGRHVHGDGEHR